MLESKSPAGSMGLMMTRYGCYHFSFIFFGFVIVQRGPLDFFLSKVCVITVEHDSLCDLFQVHIGFESD